jgi:hypothetical protein
MAFEMGVLSREQDHRLEVGVVVLEPLLLFLRWHCCFWGNGIVFEATAWS